MADLTWRRPAADWPAPVEYAVAVDRYLASSSLGESSRRVYRISLASWAWPLALLDDPDADRRLVAAIAARSRQADVRTINRELSALRSAIGWWLDLSWISHDPTAGLAGPSGPAPAKAPLTEQQLAALFCAQASLREQAFWHLLHDTGAAAISALALDAHAIDGTGRPTEAALAVTGSSGWDGQTADLLRWLLSGRTLGPLFLTERRAIHRRAIHHGGRVDICPLTGHARMSYRRAVEIFTAATQPLDPAGVGWALHQLRRPRPATAGPP